jgi:4,5-DOPA dioxygenase extradiol
LKKGVNSLANFLMVCISDVSSKEMTRIYFDMYGFPEDLYKVQYPAPNAVDFLILVKNIFFSIKTEDRGLDHGSWSILKHLCPSADIPVMQFAINANLSLKEHFEVGKQLAELREQGVMIVGSGNVTHNLSQVNPDVNATVLPWAKEFDEYIKKAILNRDFDALIDIEKQMPYAKIAHPTMEHYIPLLYSVGASDENDEISFLYEGIEHGSLSMRSWSYL